MACGLTFGLGQGGGTITLVLAGAAVSSLTAAGIALALNFAPNPYAAYEIMNWLLGSLADKSWAQFWLVLPFIVAGGALLATTGRALDALSLGEAQAESLGIGLTWLRIAAIAGTALAVGAATSVTGAIGFIGLVAPHLVRPFVGYQPSRILLPATLGGRVAAAVGRHRGAADSHRPGIEAGRLHQPGRHALLLLAGGAAEKDVSMRGVRR